MSAPRSQRLYDETDKIKEYQLDCGRRILARLRILIDGLAESWTEGGGLTGLVSPIGTLHLPDAHALAGSQVQGLSRLNIECRVPRVKVANGIGAIFGR